MWEILSCYRKLISGDNLNREERIASDSLCSANSFRIKGNPGVADALRMWKTALMKTAKAKRPIVIADGKPGIAVWDNRKEVLNIRLRHIQINGADAPSYGWSRDTSAPFTTAGKLGALTFLVIALPYFLIQFILSSKKLVWCMLPVYLTECLGLTSFVKQHGITKLYFYCPFENDSNAMYLLLRKHGVEVYKIPSPNLLAIHNHNLLADKLVLTSPYQADELSEFAETIRIRGILHWTPEQFADYCDVYTEWMEPPVGTIGYYSHGSWVRKHLGIPDAGIGDDVAEKNVLEMLSAFLKSNPGFRLVVFLHPKEKKSVKTDKVRKYYDDIFGQGRYVFGDPGLPGAKMFAHADIGIGAVSTILFERLFLGYKTIFCPEGFKGFPLSHSGINKICIRNQDELRQLIFKMSDITSQDCFAGMELEKYTWVKWREMN